MPCVNVRRTLFQACRFDCDLTMHAVTLKRLCAYSTEWKNVWHGKASAVYQTFSWHRNRVFLEHFSIFTWNVPNYVGCIIQPLPHMWMVNLTVYAGHSRFSTYCSCKAHVHNLYVLVQEFHHFLVSVLSWWYLNNQDKLYHFHFGRTVPLR